MRILIVDDEANARERLCRLISELEGDDEVIGEAGDGATAIEFCRENEVDLVLLDIRMPGLDGLETAERLATSSPPPAVILVTAYPEHALDAFERSVQDYLVKPVRAERLALALERVQVPTRPQREALEGSDPARRRCLSAYCRTGLESTPIEDVLYLQAEDKYVNVRHLRGSLLVDESLRSLEEEFPDLFIRIHRNALVSRQRLEGLIRDGDGNYGARLRDCEEPLPVSRRHLPEVRRWLR